MHATLHFAVHTTITPQSTISCQLACLSWSDTNGQRRAAVDLPAKLRRHPYLAPNDERPVMSFDPPHNMAQYKQSFF